jgi:hypothetical protein
MRRTKILILSTLGAVVALIDSAQASLIAHYTFDTDGTATVGTDATLADNATISTTQWAVGGGSLALGIPSVDAATGSSDGAVTGDTFTWATDTRSVAFWMKADASQDTNPTMISLGSGTGAGNRFDIRMTGGALRLEVQSGGTTTTTTVGDGNWYHVTVSLDDPATVATVNYYVHDTSGSLIAGGAFGGSGTAIATGDGPLRMGDSYQDAGRDFYGYLDDVRLYDNALTETDAQNLALMYNAVPEPSTLMLGGLGIVAAMALLRRRA